MRDILVWQFWVGLLIGYFLLARLIAFAKSKLSAV